jgi:hypothetical protein
MNNYKIKRLSIVKEIWGYPNSPIKTFVNAVILSELEGTEQ